MSIARRACITSPAAAGSGGARCATAATGSAGWNYPNAWRRAVDRLLVQRAAGERLVLRIDVW